MKIDSLLKAIAMAVCLASLAGCVGYGQYIPLSWQETSRSSAGGTLSVAERVSAANSYLDQGMRNGTVPKDEGLRLKGQFLQLREDEQRAYTGAYSNPAETDRINAELNRLERNIYRGQYTF